jgi:hypothetical protein
LIIKWPETCILTPRFIELDITRATASSKAKLTPSEQANIAISKDFNKLITEGELPYKAISRPDTPKTPDDALAGLEASE